LVDFYRTIGCIVGLGNIALALA